MARLFNHNKGFSGEFNFLVGIIEQSSYSAGNKKKEGGRGISNKRMDNTNNLMGYM